MVLTRAWLRRRLGVFDMYALVHSDSQSTYYFLLGFIALYAGQYAFFGAIYGVLLMAAIAVTYGEMGSRFPETGGSYLYVKSAFGSTLAYISAWLIAFDQIVMVAYGAIDAAKIINKTLGLGIQEVALAAAITTALFVLTVLGIRESANFAKAVAVVDLVVMPALIIWALATHPSWPPYFNWAGVEGASLLFAFSLLSRGFTGVDAIGQLAGEAREPLVQVPKATALVVAIGAFFGLGLTAALMSALRPEELVDPAIAPLYLAAEINPALTYAVAINLFLVMITAALAGYVSFSRLTYMLAEEGLLPGVFRRLHKRFRTPHLSLLLVYIISLVLIAPGEIEIILAIYAVGSLINYLMVAVALAKFSRSGTLYSAFKTPVVAGVPLSSAIAMALLPVGIGLTILEKYRYLWALLLWLAAGLALLYFRKRR
ncbi:amino acid/polyamine/organocation transporter, APC superfamily [Pyrobaculum islandicum DSM 4184]|uniref:Amino acid/polyamine/organocation transporter, APC superfamily n=1 Tax=Pyrobaculum islandicum (strain DSM 4184 / JCM 9189 / GEO3) TaxID=384616 RepID=A1RQK7_PYRIL|nr:APC family permease [Pyrobaculum islandicum]ABL87239.1 amino acid/polyamine/organocation transporter, APC superfamily [Pyrobaculum islandicum DSM 4184]